MFLCFLSVSVCTDNLLIYFLSYTGIIVCVIIILGLILLSLESNKIHLGLHLFFSSKLSGR